MEPRSFKCCCLSVLEYVSILHYDYLVYLYPEVTRKNVNVIARQLHHARMG
jgi:hypothetical protein